MATATRMAACSQATDAAFRAWTQLVHDLLVGACGWVQTADTGQFDLATGVAPVASPQYQGYRIYRLNDALQASAPIFLKVEFGWGGAATSTPGLRFNVGTGSDGAGTLTGTFWSNVAVHMGGGVATPAVWLANGGAGYANLIICAESSSRTMALCLERWRNTDGSYNALGACGLTVANGVLIGTAVAASVEFGLSGAYTTGMSTPFYPPPLNDRGRQMSLAGQGAFPAYLSRRNATDVRLLSPPPRSFAAVDLALTISGGDGNTPRIVQAYHDGAPRTFVTAGALGPVSRWGSGYVYTTVCLALLVE
jgi:hypothetical protein